MIRCDNNTTQFEGDIKDICKEFTYLLIGFKDTLEETFGLLSEESEAVIMECGKIAFMDPIERKQLLDQYDEYLK